MIGAVNCAKIEDYLISLMMIAANDVCQRMDGLNGDRIYSAILRCD